jgi:DMSO/TMAO reductase YedYZ molybdopterin-dependent catalytic subunit
MDHPHRSVCRRIFLTAVFAATAAAQAPAPSSSPATLKVTGEVASVLTITAGDLAQMPREQVKLQEMGHDSVSYEGVPIREILKKAGVPLGKELRGKGLSTYVLAKAHDGYQVVFSLAELDADFGDEHVIIADKEDGKPLAGERGPFRLAVANDKRAARSIRMLEELEIVRLRK